MKGRLIVLATGSSLDVIGYEGNKDSLDDLIKNLENDDWHLHSSIFIESYALFDSRSSQTKVNRLFCYRVFKSLEEGVNVVLVVPEAHMVDKRLREHATIISLPRL